MRLWRQWVLVFILKYFWLMPCTRKNQCKYETFSLITQDQSRCMLIPYQVNLCLYPSFPTSAVCMNLGMFLSSLCLSFSICKMAISSVQSLSRVWLLQPHGLQHTRLPCPLQSSEVPCRCEQPAMVLTWPAGWWCAFIIFHWGGTSW